MASSPVVSRDARFRAGRTLVQRGKCEQAISVFAILLEESRRTYGDDHFETVPAYYEYGNALFRAALQESEGESDVKEDAAKNLAAEAAEKRRGGTEGEEDVVEFDSKEALEEGEDNQLDDPDGDGEGREGEEQDEEDDLGLAMEMMETAWSILDLHRDQNAFPAYTGWISSQVPRILTGIGEVLSAKGAHADAADAYCRALEHRQEDVERFIALQDDDASKSSLDFLQCRRRFVEANLMLSEELLACPADEDVITSETGAMLVSAKDRVDFARGYYDKARDELQETVLLMGQLAAKNIDIQDEKENVCFIATLVMGVGTQLADFDAQAEAQASTEPVKKKTKT